MATKKKSYLNRILIILGIVVVLLVAARLMGWIGGKKDIQVEVDSVVRRDIISSVSESGTIQPDIEVPVAPDVSGEVVELLVKEGDSVKAGQLLLAIRPDSYQSAQEQSEASLNSAQADYAQAQANLEQTKSNLVQDSINLIRNKQLFKDRVISQGEIETFELKFKISQAQFRASSQTVNAAFYRVKSAEASLSQAKDNLRRTHIYASMSGIITMLKVEVGQRVVGTGQMAGTEIMKISDLSQMEVEVEINENDIVNVRIGDSSMVEVDAFPGEKFYGKISEIAYSATTQGTGSTDQITNFKVKISIDRASYLQNEKIIRGVPVNQSPFRPGMSSQVRIYTDKKEQVLSLPIQCVTLEKKEEESKSDEKGKEVVFVLEETTVKMVPVKTGISDDSYIEILEGLEENTQVVSGPYRVISKELQDGMTVKVKTDKEEKSGTEK
jgi:HlyD family secretion protein